MFASISHRLNTFLLVLLVLMAGSIIAILATRAGAGPLDPPAPPAPTNRNIIFQPASCAGFPITISQPGSYTLGSNITMPCGCTFKDGIDTSASNVTLDLNGFTVTGLSSNSGSGIAAGASTTNLRLSNGIVTTWSGDGIDFTNASASSIDQVTASGSANASGIGLGAMSVLSDCVSNGNYTGVAVLGSDSTVKGCDLSNDPSAGVFVGASASGVLMAGNHVTASGNAFKVAGELNIVEDNTSTNAVSPYYLLTITGIDNVAFHNSADILSGGSNYVPSNDVGPIQSVSGGTSPWANTVP